ncbi:MAG TPA: HAD family hydrolase [Steroidobacteraceae bacterium]|nr:HAD family hydrolase [Steroidobacteraceae bacterium]
MQNIRAICFDLDNTLWDVWPVIMRAEQAMYDFLAERYPRTVANVTIEALREARNEVVTQHPQMAHDFTFLRRQALRNLAVKHEYPDELVDEAFQVFIDARNDVALYDEVMPALTTLRSRYRLFTASNGNADLEKIGIAHLFERTIAARNVGALKPDPIVFQKAIEGTDLKLGEVLYVGDDPIMDVVGSRDAGMHPVWINRNGAIWPPDLEPAAITITTLDELVELTCSTNAR